MLYHRLPKKKRTTEKILGGGVEKHNGYQKNMKRKSHTQQTDNSLDQKKDTMEEHCTEDGQDGRTLNRRWAKIGRIRKIITTMIIFQKLAKKNLTPSRCAPGIGNGESEKTFLIAMIAISSISFSECGFVDVLYTSRPTFFR